MPEQGRPGSSAGLRVVAAGALLACLASSGCLWLAAGCAAGGAAGYAYVRGRIYRDYLATLDDTRRVAQAALTELGYPLVGFRHDADGTTLESRAGDGTAIAVEVIRQNASGPGSAPVTRVAVRVGVFGDEPVSERILDQISLHLVPSGGPRPTSPATLERIQPVAAAEPAQTPPPPLAPAPPPE